MDLAGTETALSVKIKSVEPQKAKRQYPPGPFGVEEQDEVDGLVILALQLQHVIGWHWNWHAVVEVPCLWHFWVDDLPKIKHRQLTGYFLNASLFSSVQSLKAL